MLECFWVTKMNFGPLDLPRRLLGDKSEFLTIGPVHYGAIELLFGEKKREPSGACRGHSFSVLECNIRATYIHTYIHSSMKGLVRCT